MKLELPETRLKFLFGLVAGFALLVVLRAAHLQLGSQPKLEALSKRQFTAKVLVRPRRGPIVDRNGEPLAINVESNSLAANPSRIKNKAKVAWLLSKAMGLSNEKVLKRLKDPKEFVWIKRHLSEAEVEECRKWRLMDMEGELVNGLMIIKESKRVYPHGEIAASVIGGVNIDSEGIEGVELARDESLRGKVVSVKAVKDALGRPAFLDAAMAKDAKDGDSIQLTLDASLQYSVEQDLKAAVQRTGARSGNVVVMNAVTGELLAIAHAPDQRRARVFTDGFEPGSTLKPLIFAGLLPQGVNLNDSVYGNSGSLVIQGKRISEAEAHEKYEWITLKRVIQVSSNVGAARMAMNLGADKTLATFNDFGLGSKTLVGFPGEISGRLPTRKEMSPLRLATAGFGQGLVVTPIQMARAYAVFANGGWLVQPSLFKDPDQKNNLPPKRILAEPYVAKVVDALHSVTEEKGTGVKARLDGYRVAGKTGTAQVVDPQTRKYSRTRYISSFVGFASGLEQKIVIFTALDEPKGVYYASDTAAPLFKAVLSSVASRYGLPAKVTPEQRLAALPDTPKNVLNERGVKEDTKPKEEVALITDGISPRGKMVWKMPDLSGMSVREVLRILQGENKLRRRKFEVEATGVGVVQSQYPQAGRPLSEGDFVRLTLREP